MAYGTYEEMGIDLKELEKLSLKELKELKETCDKHHKIMNNEFTNKRTQIIQWHINKFEK